MPLVVEASPDQKTWTEVARRTEVFETWQPKFAKQNARFLRLRVDRKSWLHLERVAVHPLRRRGSVRLDADAMGT